MNKWKSLKYCGFGGDNVIKIFIPLKAIYRLNVISIKVVMTFFSDPEKLMLNSYGNSRDSK